MTEPHLSESALTVLLAIDDEERSAPGADLPLRKIAMRALGADQETSVRILRELDLAGQVRTDMMGWQRGHLTTAGRSLAQRLRPDTRP